MKIHVIHHLVTFHFSQLIYGSHLRFDTLEVTMTKNLTLKYLIEKLFDI
jgi:hypothetical protein